MFKTDDPAAVTVNFILIFVAAAGFKFYLIHYNAVIVLLFYLHLSDVLTGYAGVGYGDITGLLFVYCAGIGIGGWLCGAGWTAGCLRGIVCLAGTGIQV